MVGDFIVDDLDGFLEEEGKFENTGVVLVYLIELQDEGLANLVDAQVVPLAPGPVVPQLLLASLAVLRLDLLELLHKLQIDSPNPRILLENRLLQGIAC